jgi:quinol monooxygenase YgiN
MTFKEGTRADFLQNFEENKSAIRNSPGCHHLELWEDEHDKNIFLTYSHWESEEFLNQYRDSELFKTVWSFTKALFTAKPIAFSSKKLEEVKG